MNDNFNMLFNKLTFQQYNTPEWDFFISGSIVKYFRMEKCKEQLTWFKANNYSEIKIDCSRMQSLDNFLKSIGVKLGFPDYYSGTLDALNDCLFDIEIAKRGLILVFENFDALYKKQPESCLAVLNILYNASRVELGFGKLLFAAIQVNDRNFELPPIGCLEVRWNQNEWIDSHRV